MKRFLLFVSLLMIASLALGQTKVWERSSAGGNFPAYMGTANTERGFTTGTLTLQPYTRIWERSAGTGTLPPYFGTNTERGFAFGTIGANDRVLLVDRKSQNRIFVLDAATGDSVALLDTTGLAALAVGSTFAVNDAEITADGVIYVCNLVTNPSTAAFRVYRWSSESATPAVALSFTGTTVRLGDNFTVTGSTADNSVAIWAAGASSNKVFRFNTTDNGATWTPTEITFTGLASAGTPAVCPNTAGTEFFVNSNGRHVKRYLVDGTLVDSIPGSVIGTGSNALRYFEAGGKKYLSVFTYGAGNENVRTVDITAGLSGAVLVGASPSLGAVANANGTGDVGLKVNGDGTVNVYVLSTNNGMGAYRLNPVNTGTRERMYVVGRKLGNQVYVVNAATGDSVARLDTTGLASLVSGTLPINDAEVSTDGVIYVGNLVSDASVSPFKIYRWKDESSTPQLAMSYTSPTLLRLGDKITVTGSTANSTVTIWAVAAQGTKVLKFTTADSGKTFTPAEITLSGNGAGSGGNPSLAPNSDATELYIKANGNYVKRYQANGTLIDSIPGSVVATGSNALRYFELAGKKYLAIFAYGAGNERARIVDVTNGLSTAAVVGKTDSLGTVANANGVGDISLKANGDGTETIYVLGTNNGIGSYLFTPPSKVATPTFSPAAGTYANAVWMRIAVGTVGAKVYYTLNGATPDSLTGILFADSVKIDSTRTVKAIAYAPGMLPSDVASITYTIISLPPAEPLYTYWANTQAAGKYPRSWSTGNFERGMAYGKVGGKDRVYVVARSGGPRIDVYDAMTGDSAWTIRPNVTVTGGTFPMNFVDVSDDGIIFVGNLTTDVATSAFKLYRWNSETDTALTVINYTNASLPSHRLGDVISVYGKASDNTLTVFAAASGKDKVVKFTTADNGATFTPTVITLSNGAMGSVPNVALAPDGSLWVKSYSKVLYHYSSTGTLIDSVLGAVVGTDGTDIAYVERLGKKYVAVYYPNDATPYTDERVAIIDVTTPANATVAYSSPSIGGVANLNGTGAVDLMPLPNDDFLVFLLGTNNGIAAFTNNTGVVVSRLDTLFYGTSKNVLANPFGSGYIVGTNSYDDRGKYQRFDFKAGDKLAGFKFWFGYKAIAGSPDTVRMVVKTVAGSGAPNTTIASVMTTTDRIDTVNGNTFLLDSTLTLTGPVFVGFEWGPTYNDAFALYSDKNGEGNAANRVWELYNDGSYGDFTTSTPNWGLDIDLWIAAYYKKGTTTGVEDLAAIPQQYSLEQNYPNPFNPSTTITFSLPQRSKVTLKVYDILGRQVAELMNEEAAAGKHLLRWNAKGLASGTYFYRLQAGDYTDIKKMLLLK
jgi:hypothetical protein